MDIFHNLGISVHECLFFLITVLGMWFIARYFSSGVGMCSSQVCIPEECFLYLVSVNIFSFYIFCMCLSFFSFLFVMFCFVCIGVSSLASLSHFCGTDFVNNILCCASLFCPLCCVFMLLHSVTKKSDDCAFVLEGWQKLNGVMLSAVIGYW